MKDQLLKHIHKLVKELSPTNILKQEVRLDSNNLFIGKNTYNLNSFNQVHVVGLGKNAYQDVNALHKILKKSNNIKLGQLVAFNKTDRNLNDSNKEITLLEGDHPYTSSKNIDTTLAFCGILSAIAANDLTIVLISGGTSALIEQLPSSIAFDDYDKIQKLLINSNLNIEKINTVRKSLSMIKNGGLISHIGSNTICQLTSCDIPTGDIASVGSSPLLHTKINKDEVLSILESIKTDSELLDKISAWFNSLEFENYQLELQISQTQKQIDHVLTSDVHTLRDAAITVFQGLDKKGVNTNFPIYNEPMKQVVEKEILRIKNQKGTLFLSGGEASVDVGSTQGRGGRNTHFCAVMADKIFNENVFNLSEEKLLNAWVLSFATDGTDGPTENAGALFYGELYKSKPDFKSSIAKFDTLSLFESLGLDLGISSTGINLMDLRAIYIPS